MPQSTMSDATDLRPAQEPASQHPIERAPFTYSEPLDALAPAGHLGTRDEIEAELDLIAASIRSFHRLQPDMVLRYCGGYTARLTELQVLLHRVEGTNRQYTRIRTQQVDRFIAELDRQWKTASRLIEVMRQDLQMQGVHV